MRMGHLAQADIDRPDVQARFWMDSCGGRDPVAMTVLTGGWESPDAPLPVLVVGWCVRLRPVLIDLGADTGFLSLLAAATGARHVHAVEPIGERREILAANVASSELADRLTIHAETPRADALAAVVEGETPAIVRVASAGHGALAMLSGVLQRSASAVLLHIAAGVDADMLAAPLLGAGYRAFAPSSYGAGGVALTAAPLARMGAARRVAVFLPAAGADRWRTGDRARG